MRRRGLVVITTAKHHSAKPNLSSVQVQFLLVACWSIVTVRISEKCSRLELRLNAFRQSTIPQKQFIITIGIIIIMIEVCGIDISTSQVLEYNFPEDFLKQKGKKVLGQKATTYIIGCLKNPYLKNKIGKMNFW